VAQAKKELEEWEASKLATQKKWTKWMKAQAEAGRNPTPEALEAASAAQREYQEAQAVAEKEGAEALAADSIAAKEWDELQQARKETEREMEEFTAAQARVVKEREMLQVAAAEQQSEQLKAEEKAQERERLYNDMDAGRQEMAKKQETMRQQLQELQESKVRLQREAERLEDEKIRMEQEQQAWEETKQRMMQDHGDAEDEREYTRKEVEAERLQLQEEKEAMEQERLQWDNTRTHLEAELGRMQARVAELMGPDMDHSDTSSAGGSRGAIKAIRNSHSAEGRRSVPDRAADDLPGLNQLREEFETFRRQRREAWQQGRQSHQQQERQWLNNYLGSGATNPTRSVTPGAGGSIPHPGLRTAGKVTDWNIFRSVAIPLGTFVHLKLSFQRADLGQSGQLDLTKLSWAQKQGGIPNTIPADQLRWMVQSVDAGHSGVVSFWEFLGIQMFLMMRLGEKGFDFREWLTFVAKSWHPNHFPSRSSPMPSMSQELPHPFNMSY
jgi:hypothetical protein